MPAHLVALETAPDLVDQVYRALLDAICDGALVPGERVLQEEVAAKLAVSRQPVLQALRLLKKDGFVVDAPGRGVRVAPLDAGWIVRVYQVRGALDALAARLAAQRRWRIDARLLAMGRQAAQGRDIRTMMDMDTAFHRAIYQASGNPLIEESAQLHWRHLRRAMGAVLQSARQRAAVWDEHESIAQAIAAGDEDEAARRAQHHTAQASQTLAERLQAVLHETREPHPQGDSA